MKLKKHWWCGCKKPRFKHPWLSFITTQNYECSVIKHRFTYDILETISLHLHTAYAHRNITKTTGITLSPSQLHIEEQEKLAISILQLQKIYHPLLRQKNEAIV